MFLLMSMLEDITETMERMFNRIIALTPMIEPIIIGATGEIRTHIQEKKELEIIRK